MQSTTPQPTQDPTRRYRCRHIFTDGHRCGSPSLRGEDLCYYHHKSRHDAQLAGRNGQFLMPRIDDRPAIQIALYDILSRLAQFDIDPKRAGMLLYGLQIASSNLAKHEKSAVNSEPVVEDLAFSPIYGDLAPITEIPETTPSTEGKGGAPHLAFEMWEDVATKVRPESTLMRSEASAPLTSVISTGGEAGVEKPALSLPKGPPHFAPAQPPATLTQSSHKNRPPRCQRNLHPPHRAHHAAVPWHLAPNA
jgi:hypothetical protein